MRTRDFINTYMSIQRDGIDHYNSHRSNTSKIVILESNRLDSAIYHFSLNCLSPGFGEVDYETIFDKSS
jgi:hypothetical protein